MSWAKPIMQPSFAYSNSCLQCIRNTRHGNDPLVCYEPLPVGDFGPAVNEDKVAPCGFGACVVLVAVAKKDGGMLDIAVGYFAGEDFGHCIGTAGT